MRTHGADRKPIAYLAMTAVRTVFSLALCVCVVTSNVIVYDKHAATCCVRNCER